MPTTQHIEERPYGWVVVAVATVCMAAAFGSNLTVSILVAPYQAEFGWSRADISMAYTLLAIGAGGGGLVWGSLSDRFGAKKIAYLGATALSLCLILISFQSNLMVIYGLYFVMGAFGFGCLFTPVLALTGLWFDKRKGLAMGVVTAGGALGQGIIPFVERIMISAWGWREAMLYLGISYFVLLIPMLFLLKPPPILAQGNKEVFQSNDNVWKMPHRISLSWLSAAGIFCCICMAAPLMHLVPLGMDMGLDPNTATGLLFALMTSGVFGRLFFGTMADKVGGLKAYFIASIGQTVMVFWFTQTTSLPALYILAILFGFSFSGVMTCLLICAREAAPLKMTGLAVAIVGATGWIGMGVGGFQAGHFFDLTGSYTLSYGNAALAGMINLVIVGSLLWFRRRRTFEIQLA